MGTVLNFQPSVHPARPSAPKAEMGQLLLFTGVRYERTTDAEADKPARAPRGRRIQPRRRT